MVRQTGSEHEEAYSLSKEFIFHPICEGELWKDGDMTTGMWEKLFWLSAGRWSTGARCSILD